MTEATANPTLPPPSKQPELTGLSLLDLRKQAGLLREKSTLLQPAETRRIVDDATALLAALTEQQDASDPYDPAISRCHIALSKAYFRLSEMELALEHALIAGTISAQAQDESYGFALEAEGLVLARLGDYAKAIERFREALELAEQLDIQQLAAYAYRGLGIAYGELNEIEKSNHYSHSAYDLFYKTNNLVGQVIALNNICRGHMILEEFDIALDYGLNGYALSQRHGYRFVDAALASNIGNVYRGLEQYETAHHYFDRALVSAKELSDDYFLATTYSSKGRSYFEQKEYADAKTMLGFALQTAVDAGNPYWEYISHKQLAELHKETGDFPKALDHYELFHRTYDKHAGIENARRTRYLEIAFNVEAAQREANIFREKSEELEEKVARRTQELEVLTTKLQAAYQRESELSELKSTIISTVSHEFRTPLTVINSSVDMLTRHYDRIDATKRSRLHKRIHGSIFYLTDLLQDVDLVDAAKSGQLTVHPANVSFAELCERLEKEVTRESGRPENLSFEYAPDDESIHSVDYRLLKQTVFNLLTNALKYSSALAPIVIVLKATPSLSVSVSDKGIGIPTCDMDQIWELFYRGSNVDTRRGLGLGLYIVNQLALAMGGTIAVDSAEDEGTTFTLTL